MTTATATRPAERKRTDPAADGVRIEARAITQHAGDHQLLQATDLVVEPGELLAIVGGSGAGKTTLLETLAGLRLPSSGTVAHDGFEVTSNASASDAVGYVPQDDIIHGDLALGRTLRHAARLRLPHHLSEAAIETVVEDTLWRLDLTERANLPVRQLSGGQRKRASIAVELLTRPRLIFLDEPTSGLDPATALEVMGLLRNLADAGTTVVVTTHSPDDIAGCDRVLFLARDGHLAFDGHPDEATAYFEVGRMAEVYSRIATDGTPSSWSSRFQELRGHLVRDPWGEPAAREESKHRRSVGELTNQWATLTRRNGELLVKNRLTFAITLGSPLLVTLMMTILFQPGSFGGDRPIEGINLAFWLSFDAFFFGVTYGLLQIVTEFSIFRRERRSGISVGAYVLAKITLLLPVLIAIDVIVLGVLRFTDRLPAEGLELYGPLAAVFLLDALVGLAFGLLASALVRDPAQAALALPLICFPQVLFAGAAVPVSAMAAPGEWMSTVIANRWAFEAMARILEAGDGATGAGMPDFGSAIVGSAAPGAAVLAVMAALVAVATTFSLHRRSRIA